MFAPSQAMSLGDVVPYLVSTGLLSASDVVDGALRVAAHRRRNRSYSVTWGSGQGLFLKQLTPVEGAGRSELVLYARAASAADASLRTLPRALALDHARDVLVLELVQPARPLWSLVGDETTDGATVFGRLGVALADLHRLLSTWRGHLGREHGPWPDVEPWGFRLDAIPLRILAELSAANAELLRILIKELPSPALRAAKDAWQPSTLVHHDLKLDNVLSSTPGGVPRIVDWEFAGWGDPAWDVGTMLQSALSLWVDDETREDRVAGESRLSAVQACCAAFWQGYTASSALSARDVRRFRARAVLLSALRLFQSAYEHGHRAARIAKFSVLAAQVGANVLSDPDRAATSLYGLD